MAKVFNTEMIRKAMKSAVGFDKILNRINVIKAEDGIFRGTLKVGEEHTNPMYTLHGGLSAAFVDSLTTVALMTHKKSGDAPHMTVDIHVSYIKPATVDDEIQFDSKAVHVGKNMAYTQCYITNKETGALLVKGTLTKYFLPSPAVEGYL